MKERTETTIHFQNSNLSFYHALLSSSQPSIDIYIKIELLILYFRRNAIQSEDVTLEKQKMIKDLLEGNYQIREEQILLPDKTISIEELYDIKREIETRKGDEQRRKIITIPSPKQKEEKPNQEPGKIISFTKYYQSLMYNMQERAYIFEVTNRIDTDTIPYIEETEKNMSLFLDHFIEDAFSGKLENYSRAELFVLYAYLSLYPFIEYEWNQYKDALENLNIPQNQIGLRKSTYKDAEVEGITQQLAVLRKEQQEIENQITFLQENHVYNRRLKYLYRQLTENQKQQEIIMINLYLHTHTAAIYNKNLLKYISKCYYQSHVVITPSGDDPIIKMFYIEKEQVEFYCAMHLSTLISLIDAKILLGQEDKRLKLEVKNE